MFLTLGVLAILLVIWVVIPKVSYRASLQPFLWVNLQLRSSFLQEEEGDKILPKPH